MPIFFRPCMRALDTCTFNLHTCTSTCTLASAFGIFAQNGWNIPVTRVLKSRREVLGAICTCCNRTTVRHVLIPPPCNGRQPREGRLRRQWPRQAKRPGPIGHWHHLAIFLRLRCRRILQLPWSLLCRPVSFRSEPAHPSRRPGTSHRWMFPTPRLRTTRTAIFPTPMDRSFTPKPTKLRHLPPSVFCPSLPR